MRVALYVRVSTEDQAKEGFSIEAQKRRLAAFSESQDWEIADFYVDDGYSAKDLNRPEMKRLLIDITTDRVDVVLVYKLDRLTRSTSDCDHLLKMFEANKVAFQSCTESFETRTATGRLFIRLIADIAQWERENIGERVRFGLEQKVIEGKKPGGKYPFGYAKDGILVPDEADTIRRLRDLYMKENLGFKSIAIRLNQDGLTRRGFEWRASTAALSLENPFYAGIIQYGGKMANGKYPQRKRDLRVEVLRSYGSHEAIFTEDEYNEHIRLMRRRTDEGYSRKGDYWFTGLLRCGKCGYSMHGRMSNGRVKKDGERTRTPYYICSRRKENDKCNMPIIRQEHIEHLMIEHISSMRVDQNVNSAEKRKIKSQQVSRERTIQKLKTDLDGIKERVKKWQYMFVQDLVKADDLRIRLDEEYVRETEIKKQIEELRSHEQESEFVVNFLSEVLEAWPIMLDSEKKEVLATVYEEIRIFTKEDKPKGVKNRFYDASIQVKYRL
jgi:site-specific DNA recombinase